MDEKKKKKWSKAKGKESDVKTGKKKPSAEEFMKSMYGKKSDE